MNKSLRDGSWCILLYTNDVRSFLTQRDLTKMETIKNYLSHPANVEEGRRKDSTALGAWQWLHHTHHQQGELKF